MPIVDTGGTVWSANDIKGILASGINPPVIGTVASPHRDIVSKYDDKNRPGQKRVDKQIDAEANGKTKVFRLNNPTIQKFIYVWGVNSDAWVGKKFKISIKLKDVGGEEKEILYGEPLL
jgi:hypothetical protein